MTGLLRCPDGGIGRRTVFRWRRSQGRGGSSPLLGTIYSFLDIPDCLQNPGKPGIYCPWLFQGKSGYAPKIRPDWGHGMGHCRLNAPILLNAMPPNGSPLGEAESELIFSQKPAAPQNPQNKAKVVFKGISEPCLVFTCINSRVVDLPVQPVGPLCAR